MTTPTSSHTPNVRERSPLMRAPIISLLLATSVLPLATGWGPYAGEPGEAGKRLKVVVFGGHPDDPESGAGGLIATLTRQGVSVRPTPSLT
jgi:hypothetical protein